MKPVNLNRREKMYVATAVVVVALFLVFQMIVFPVSNRRDRLERALTQKTEALKEIRALQSEYFALEKNAQHAKSQLVRRDKSFTLFSFLGNLADEVGIKKNVSSMKPTSSIVDDVKITAVDLKIDAITMEQLTKYLYSIEYSGNNLFVKRMVISRTSKPEGYIDVSIQVETVES